MDGLTVAFDPQRVRAIVVGLENYEAWEMRGPARDALRICAWLRSHGVLPDRIGLWLSASPDRLAEMEERAESLGVACREARSRDQLMDVFTGDLEEQDDHDTLFVFWGGHGMEHGGDRVLFTPDATHNNPRCIAFGDLRRHLADRRFHSTRHVMFVDVCGEFFNPGQSDVPPVVAPFPQGHRRGVGEVAQYSLLASAPGQSAGNDEVVESGFFSRAVLDWLEEHTEDRHIDLDALMGAVRERLEHEAALDRQTPMHVWAWTGDDSRRLVYASPARPEDGELADMVRLLASRSRSRLCAELATLLDRGTIEIPWTAVVPTVAPERTQGTGFDQAMALRARYPHGQLVVVGGPGKGKSVLLRQIAQALATDPGRGNRIPVVFSPATWNPRLFTLTEWMRARLGEEHKDLVDGVRRAGGQAAVDRLLERCLPILDGFDELPRNLREPAQQQLNVFRGPVVLSSRTDAYEQALATRALLPDAVVLRIEPLDDEVARAYLSDRKYGGAATRWKQLFETVDAGSGVSGADRQLAAVLPYLDSPLMLWLANVVYAESGSHGPGAEPDAMSLASDDASHDEVARQLLSKLVHAVFVRDLGRTEGEGEEGKQESSPVERTEPVSAEHWLRFLAAGLPKEGDREIGWWKVTGLAPVRRIGAAAAAVAGLLLGSLNHIWPHMVLCAVHGLLLGLFFGACYGGAYSARRAILTGRAAGRYGYGGVVAGTDTDPALYRRYVRDGVLQLLCLVAALALTDPDAVRDPLTLSGSLALGSVLAAVVGLVGGDVTARVLRHFAKFDAAVAGARAPAPAVAVRRDGFATLSFAGLSFVVCLVLLVMTMPWIHGSGPVPIVCGALASTVTACLMFNAWPGYRIAHAWLALSEDLPWEFMKFLDEARRLGVLRQHSISYIFRHDRLAEVLAERHAAAEAPVP